MGYDGKHCGEIEMANKIVREIIHAKGIDIGIYTKDFENEYISLTDIAKYRNDNDPRFVIQNWMRNRNTVEFLAVWEELHNPDFNRVQFEAVRSEAGLNRFVMTPTKWIEQTNAIGIVSKAGRYGGGTYAHSDIAMAFATWISPEFQLYIMKDYRRLKIGLELEQGFIKGELPYSHRCGEGKFDSTRANTRTDCLYICQ